MSDLGQDEVVAVRVFRFLEDRSDERNTWEQGLHNVNSGSLLWLLVHMLPKMHSMSGAKYGKWFTVHTINVQAKHFGSNYHMFNEGSAGPAKTFGASNATQNLVTGEKLEKGYFWRSANISLFLSLSLSIPLSLSIYIYKICIHVYIIHICVYLSLSLSLSLSISIYIYIYVYTSGAQRRRKAAYLATVWEQTAQQKHDNL